MLRREDVMDAAALGIGDVLCEEGLSARARPLGAGRVRALAVLAPGAPEPSSATAALPRSARVSLTERCDFACTYCRPSRHVGRAEERLGVAGWKALFDGMVRAGVRRVRLTGGEPLLHPHLLELVEHLSSLGLEDLALTTNGSQLARLAAPLRRAGLRRVNVSLDTLEPARFRELTHGGALAPVLSGVEAALDAGLAPIKTNTVVLRGFNDDELERILEWAWERRIAPRFLELMPIGEGAALSPAKLVTIAEVRRRLARHLHDGAAELEPHRGPARYVASRRDPTLRAGFISGTSDTFCSGCDRLRVSSTGMLRPCLALDRGVEALVQARAGDAGAIAESIAAAWRLKPDGKSWRGCTEKTAATLSIGAIGG